MLDPYPPLAPLQQKRLAARRHKTTYCYDFPSVFGNALREAWAARAAAGEPNAVPPPGADITSCTVARACLLSSKAFKLALALDTDLLPGPSYPSRLLTNLLGGHFL